MRSFLQIHVSWISNFLYVKSEFDTTYSYISYQWRKSCDDLLKWQRRGNNLKGKFYLVTQFNRLSVSLLSLLWLLYMALLNLLCSNNQASNQKANFLTIRFYAISCCIKLVLSSVKFYFSFLLIWVKLNYSVNFPDFGI